MIVATFRLDWFDDYGGDGAMPFFDCFFYFLQTFFFFYTVEANVFVQGILEHRERDGRPFESGN